MAEITRVALEQNTEVLSTLEVDGVLVLVKEGKGGDWQDESLRCLDWSLNHQLRRAREKMGNLPVFVPSMNKIKAPYVVLCSTMADKNSVEQNCQSMAFKSVAIVCESGGIPKVWEVWNAPEVSSVIMCERASETRGVNT